MEKSTYIFVFPVSRHIILEVTSFKMKNVLLDHQQSFVMTSPSALSVVRVVYYPAPIDRACSDGIGCVEGAWHK